MNKYLWKTVILGLLIALNFCLSSCHDVISIMEDDIEIVSVESTEIQEVKDYIRDFMSAINTDDAGVLRKMIGEGKFFSIQYFMNGRDLNIVLLLNSNHIRDDRMLDKDGERLGASLYSMFLYYIEDSDIPVHTSEYLSSISFGIDWHSASESEVEDKLEDIVDTLEKIILVNNKYIPQIFVLKDNIYAFTESNAVLEPYEEFTGDWVIFEKTKEGYRILAVIDLQ